MSQIGNFRRTATGFAGRIRTLSFNTEFVILPAEPSDAERFVRRTAKVNQIEAEQG